VGLRASLGFAGVTALLLALVAWRLPLFRELRRLPQLADPTASFGAEASVSAVVP
jgi:hypothetical protein